MEWIGGVVAVFAVMWVLESLFRGSTPTTPPTWTAEDDLRKERMRDGR
jgi:hypothetical protein